MKGLKASNKESLRTSGEILRLVHQLMTKEEANHTTFDGASVDGTNVGAVLSVTRSNMKETADCCGMNIYISNNIQGVNNSIVVGSEVKMGEPGLGLSFGDIKWEKEKRKVNSSYFLPGFKFTKMTLFAFVFVCVLFALFGVVSIKEMDRFRLFISRKERNEVIEFPT